MAYATLDQANEFVRSYYSSVDPLRIAWNALSNDDKTVQLNKASLLIDQVPFTRGTPVDPTKAFPRDPDREYSLQQAQLATIELAIQNLNGEAKTRYELQNQGVVEYEIGDLREKFGDVQGFGAYSGVDPYVFSIIFPFLRKWLGGGFRICPTHTHKCFGRRVLK